MELQGSRIMPTRRRKLLARAFSTTTPSLPAHRVPNALIHAHLVSASSRHALLVYGTPSRMPISHQLHRTLLTRMRNLVAYSHLASTASRMPRWCMERRRACSSRISRIAPCPAGVRNLVAHANLTSVSSRHVHSRAERQLERCEQPNQRVQPTPLAASEIGAFLKTPFVSKRVSISTAAQLKRVPLGGSLLQLSSLSQWFMPDPVTLYRHISHLSRSARTC
jgi:hypothetical protein